VGAGGTFAFGKDRAKEDVRGDGGKSKAKKTK
jgi:hypothetical protein